MSFKDTHLEAALLFGAHPTVSLEQLLPELNKRFETTDITLEDCSPTGNMAGNMIAILSCSSFHIVISQNATPYSGEAFDAVTAKCDRTQGEIIAHHRKHIIVSVGLGPYQNAGKRKKAKDKRAPVLLGIKALHRTVLTLMGLSEPLAVYWGQSGRILTPDEMSETSQEDFPASLVTTPVQFGSTTDGSGRAVTGFFIAQSTLFFGKTLILEASDLTAEDANELAAALLQGFLDNDLDMKDGDIVTFCSDQELFISHQPGNRKHPGGFIRASFSPSPTQEDPTETRTPLSFLAPLVGLLDRQGGRRLKHLLTNLVAKVPTLTRRPSQFSDRFIALSQHWARIRARVQSRVQSRARSGRGLVALTRLKARVLSVLPSQFRSLTRHIPSGFSGAGAAATLVTKIGGRALISAAIIASCFAFALNYTASTVDVAEAPTKILSRKALN